MNKQQLVSVFILWILILVIENYFLYLKVSDGSFGHFSNYIFILSIIFCTLVVGGVGLLVAAKTAKI